MSETNNGVQQSTPETAPPMPVVPDKQAERDAYELAMFEQGLKATGEELPANYKTPKDYFMSLKNAQRGYTQARQEIAELRKNIPETVTQPVNQEEPKTMDNLPVGDAIRIEPKQPQPVETPKLTADLWVKWGREIDSTGGLSETTKTQIKTLMNADDVVINDFVNQRKAAIRLAKEESANVVGGQENLKAILNWAGSNLSPEEQEAANKALQSPAYKVTLLGLKARYEAAAPSSRPVQSPLVNEPSSPTPRNVLNVPPPSKPEVVSFRSEAEMKAYIADPRYRTDASFRRMVEQKIVYTSQVGYSG